MAIDIPYETFWELNPRLIKSYIEGFKKKQKQKDYEMWIMGLYVQNAVAVAVEHCLAGNKAKSKYLEKPLSEIREENKTAEEMTDKEKLEQVEKMFEILEIKRVNFELEKARKQKAREQKGSEE